MHDMVFRFPSDQRVAKPYRWRFWDKFKWNAVRRITSGLYTFQLVTQAIGFPVRSSDKWHKKFGSVSFVLTICGCFSLFGCRAPSTNQSQKQSILGRLRWVKTDKYDLFSRDIGEAEALKPWIDRELESFHARFEVSPKGRGLILAIEPGDEPNEKVLEWAARNVDRTRTVHLSPESNRWVYQTGRPYCLSRGTPYFRESFAITSTQSEMLIPLPFNDGRYAWMCFLTTDAHLLEAFDSTLKRSEETAVHVDDGLGLLKLQRWMIHGDYKSIDKQLMQLQRREVLWSVLIRSEIGLQTSASKLTKGLEKEIDEEYGRIFLSRKTG